MSHRTILQRRAALLAAASLAGLGFAASPALAGTDGDAPPAIEQPPAPPPPTPLPLPEAPAPTLQTAPTPSGGTQGEEATSNRGTKPAVKKAATKVSRQVAFKTTTRRAAGVTTIPTGSVQAGGGGTSLSPATPAGVIGLAGGSLVLLLASAGLAGGRRRGTSN